MAGHKNHITSITYSPTGKHLVSGSIDKTIRQWVASTGDPFSPVIAGHTLPVTSVTYSPTGTYLASASKDKTIRQWVASTGESFGPIMVGHTDWVTSVNYSPKGEHLASGGWDRTVRQWGTQSGELSGSVMQAGKSTVTAVTYSREGTYLASGNDDGTIRQWDASTGQPYKTVINYKSPVGSVSSVNYSPDGKRLASGSQDKKIRQWVASKGDAILPVIKGHTEDVSSVTYSPDGKYLASGSHDNTIRQWDASTGQPYKAVMKGHAGPVTSVAYSPPDGKYLVSASEDKTIRQWVASTGKPFGPIMTGHTDKVNSVSYSSTGQYLASAGDDCRICVWNSGLTGDFSLLWRTRSYSDPLLAIGLRLQGVSGLRNDQKELLSYAGYQEKDKDEPTLFHSLNNYSSKDKVDGKLSNDDKMSDAGSSVEEFNPNVLKQKIAVTENDSFIGKHESDQNLNLENSSTSTTDPSEFSSNLETHGIIPLFKNTLSSSIDSEDDVDSPSVDSLSVTSNTTSEIQSTSDINSIAHSLFVDIVENNNDPQNNKDFLYPSELFVILTTFLEKSTIKQCFDLRLGLEEIISRKLKVFDETISGKWHFIFNDLNQHSMFEKKNFQDLLYETLKHANPSFFENIGYRIDSNQSEIELNDYQIEMLVWKILLHSEILLQQKLENTSNTESITQLKQIDAAIIRVERLFQLICRRTFQFENKIKQKLLALEQKMDSTTHAIKELSSFSLFAKDWSTQLMTEPKICDLIYTYFKFETLVIAEEETIEQLPMRRLKIFSLLNQQQSPSKKKIGFFNHLFYENSELTKHMDAIKRLNNNEKNFTNTELLEYQRLQQEKSDKLLRLLENYKTEILYLNELFEYKPNSQIKEFEAHDKEQRKSYQSIKNRYEFNIQDWQKKMTQDIVKKLKHAEIQEQTKEPKFKFRGGIHG